MSQNKAQLIAPVGIFTASGINATGVITASSFVGNGAQLQGVGVGTTGSINSLGIITAASFSGNAANITGIAITGSINTSGIITASAFYGSGANLSGVGLGTQSSINTTGIITASKFFGDGSGLTGIGGAFTVLTFSPSSGATGVDPGTNIVLTFNKSIQRGTGTITIRSGSASGTIVESFDAATSSRLSINGGVLTIDPTSDLSITTTYYVVLPAGTIKDTYNDTNTLINTYSFTTATTVNKLFAWGDNSSGNLGQNNGVPYSSPIQIPGISWSQVDGYSHTIAKKTDNTLWTWGRGLEGQLGQNDKISLSSPIQVPGVQWSRVSAGFRYSVATKTDGTLWTWGRNSYGSLGQNDVVPRSSPIQIPGTQWNSISNGNGSDHTLATKTDGTLWSWGYNVYGQLGQNNLTYRSSPIQIPGTQWNKLFSGYRFSGATKTDGTLWSWGYNYAGTLGHNTSIPYSSPRQIPGTQWNNTSAAYYHMLATKTDGTLWAWGYNGNGASGLNDIAPRSSPTQIPGTSWSLDNDCLGSDQSFARKTDNTLWIWGRNSDGQLGLSDVSIPRSSPTQIPGTQWTSVSQGNRNTFAIKTE
jgi:alpha-tubulin suppressor-like RCC1 family protein